LKEIFDKYDKALLASLPRVLFDGHIEVIVSERDAERAVKFLMKQPILGFDTETRPSFSRGKMNKVALLQVSTNDVCFLFRLNRIDIPQCLVRLLEDKKITKVGLSWHDDLRALNGRKSFRAGTFVELQDMAGQMGIVDISLQKLYANIFGQKISKGQRLTNWEADDLTEAQKKYAATDAWACIRLYEEMQRMQREGYSITQTHSEEKEKMEI
jgi:ribonuclease D